MVAETFTTEGRKEDVLLLMELHKEKYEDQLYEMTCFNCKCVHIYRSPVAAAIFLVEHEEGRMTYFHTQHGVPPNPAAPTLCQNCKESDERRNDA